MDFEIIRSKRRTICLQIKRDGTVCVRAPMKMTKKQIDEFVLKHIDWIKKKQELVKNRHIVENFDEKAIKELKKKLQETVEPIIEYYSSIIGVKPNKISINSRFSSILI